METIRDCIKRTAALLPAFYLEAHYQNVLAHLLETDFEVTLELPVPLKLSDGFLFGMGRIDLFVKHRVTGQKFILELKANQLFSARNLQKATGQLDRYLTHCGHEATGVLVFFGLVNSGYKIIPYNKLP
jgi:hypothetical protein